MNSAKKLRQGHRLLRLSAVIILMFLLAAAAHAQQTTGVPCSTSATRTIDGKYVPSPPPDFGVSSTSTLRIQNPAGLRRLWRPKALPTCC